MTDDSRPVEFDRSVKQPNKIKLDDGVYRNIGILGAHFDIPKYQVYGYTLEYAINSHWDEVQNYIESEKKESQAVQALEDEVDIDKASDIHVEWDENADVYRFVLKFPNKTTKTLGIIREVNGEWNVEFHE